MKVVNGAEVHAHTRTHAQITAKKERERLDDAGRKDDDESTKKKLTAKTRIVKFFLFSLSDTVDT